MKKGLHFGSRCRGIAWLLAAAMFYTLFPLGGEYGKITGRTG